jgi:hypothetical protein
LETLAVSKANELGPIYLIKVFKSHASKPLAFMHIDICGLFKLPSLGGSRYFINFVDDFFVKIWVYFLTRKAQALDKFKIFQHKGKHAS